MDASLAAALPPPCTAAQPAAACRTGQNPGLLKEVRGSVMNFTNPVAADYPSQGCAINGLLYTESVPFQEVLNVTQDFQLEWISVHPFHHHLNPFQLTELDNAYGTPDNGSWQIGDWMDTILTTNVANAGNIRWMPGPIAATGGLTSRPSIGCCSACGRSVQPVGRSMLDCPTPMHVSRSLLEARGAQDVWLQALGTPSCTATSSATRMRAA